MKAREDVVFELCFLRKHGGLIVLVCSFCLCLANFYQAVRSLLDFDLAAK